MPNELTTYASELEFALGIIQEATSLVLGYWNKNIEPSLKSDGSYVTAADRECEKLISESIRKAFPNDAILGEEEGETKSPDGSTRKWLIDPIDGTFNFVRGVPFFSILLALEENEEIVLGVVAAPAMQDLFWACKGGGAYKNGKPIHVSSKNKLNEAYVSFGEMRNVFKQGLEGGFQKIVSNVRMCRCFGDYLSFAYAFEGKSDASIEVGVSPWDLAPMKIIIEEAGGRYSDLDGGTSIYTDSCLVSNGLLHDGLLNMLLNPAHVPL
jgi:histidinol-phosphatase